MLIVRKVASFVLSVHNFLLGELLHFKFPIFKKKKKNGAIYRKYLLVGLTFL